MTKYLPLFVLTICSFLFACNSDTATDEGTTESTTQTTDHSDHSMPAAGAATSKSPRKAAMANVGDNHVHVDYSSPSVRGRQIFGGLVGFDEVWVTGAHSATNITFGQDVRIGDTIVPKGKYGFFTIPGREQWTLILNRDWDMHLADEYDAEQDIIRLKVTPQMLETPVESLTYEVTETSEGRGEITVSWDRTAVTLPFENNQ